MESLSRNNNVQVISRAAGILRALAADTSGLSLGQIANRLELPRSTVQRLVSALAVEGLVTTERTGGGIRLGPQVHALALAATADRADRMKPVMQHIASETGETVDLAALDHGRMLFLDQIEGSHRLRTVSRIGDSFPLTTTANGKAALACLDPAQAARLVLNELEATGHSDRLTSILAELDAIRGGALATDEDEHTDGISALGFAVRDRAGDVLAVSIPVPSSRFARNKAALTRVLTQARDTAVPG